MKHLGMIGGAAVMVVGSIFIVQGVGLLPGSAMTGQIVWAYIGAGLVLGGLGLIAWGHRRGLDSRDKGSRG
jgi:hypothetical protein